MEYRNQPWIRLICNVVPQSLMPSSSSTKLVRILCRHHYEVLRMLNTTLLIEVHKRLITHELWRVIVIVVSVHSDFNWLTMVWLSPSLAFQTHWVKGDGPYFPEDTNIGNTLGTLFSVTLAPHVPECPEKKLRYWRGDQARDQLPCLLRRPQPEAMFTY